MARASTPGTRKRVLELWQNEYGEQLSERSRHKFLDSADVAKLAKLPEWAVRSAFSKSLRLEEALPIARELLGVANRKSVAVKKAAPPRPTPKKKRGGSRVSRSSRQQHGTDSGPGPTGFYGGLGRLANRAPDFDPNPGRSCPSCDRPESGCIC